MILAAIEKLLDKRIIICVGPGGVGKTTISALLGLYSARLGRKAICVTVDPSERLAESLGLKHRIDFTKTEDETFHDTGKIDEKIHGACEGLDAIIIHGSWVVDRAMARYIPDDKWETIRKGKIYPYMRHTLRGLHELAGMVLVDDLVKTNRWDTVIVDTAPSDHAIDFLEMPDRIAHATRSPAVSILMGTTSLSIPGKKFIGKASSVIMKSIGKIIGLEFLYDLSEFITLNKESLENICRAAETIRADLLSGGACIVQVTAPGAQSIDKSLFLHRKIKKEGFSTEAIVINRVLPFGPDGEEPPCQGPQTGADNGLEKKLELNFTEMKRVSIRQEKEIGRLMKKTPHVVSYFKVPLLDDDVFDIPVLKRLLEDVEILSPEYFAHLLDRGSGEL